MTREEFIGKLQMVYVGDKNASADIISEYDSLINLNNQLVEECQRLDDKETRLKNIKKELEILKYRLNYEEDYCMEDYDIDKILEMIHIKNI